MPQPAPSPIPEGTHTITPHLFFEGNCADAIEFYQKALGAELLGDPVPSPDGSAIWHVMLQIGDSRIMAADAVPGQWERGPAGSTSVGLWLYVADCDEWFARAVDAGCAVVDEPTDQFWGDRSCKVKDPFGHTWAFATRKLVFSEEEMAQFTGGGD